MKKIYKELYRSVKKPQIITAPKLPIIYLSGAGNPNDNPEFEAHIQALYQLSYGFRMSYKKDPIDGYFQYTVGSLEGFWSTSDNQMYDQDKDKLTYKIFIVQPEFVTEEVFLDYQAKLIVKNPLIADIKFEYIEEGLCAQQLHIGPFDDEPQTVQALTDFIHGQGYQIINDSHHEIYLSDFRRVTPDKYRTLIRYKIK